MVYAERKSTRELLEAGRWERGCLFTADSGMRLP
jgi:hypothetical protein